MNNRNSLPGSVGVLLDAASARSSWECGENAWFLYCPEILAHLGISYDTVADLDSGTRSHRLLLAPAGVRPVSPAQLERAGRWIRSGGTLILCGDPGALAALAGVQPTGTVDEGHVVVADAPIWGPAPDLDLHAFGGVGLKPAGAEVVAYWRDTDRAAITYRLIGRGAVVCLGPDLWQSIVRIQQGWPIRMDGTPAEDGTVPVDDDILKCEDGLALSYSDDRGQAPGTEFRRPFRHEYPPNNAAPLFHRPQADIWRSLFARVLWWAGERAGIPVPWLFYWPAGVEAVAHMSHDSDGNTDESARDALAAFAEADVAVTWCVMHPGGYSPSTYSEITAAGHEIALHYNAMGDTQLDQWGPEFLEKQHSWLRDTAGIERAISNKNHYTRWEGWTQFFRWCESEGIEIDQSRGPSKQGDVGFTFGSCHPSFPMAGQEHRNRLIDVLSLPLHAQDLAWTTIVANRSVILDQARAQHGVAHFLFHGWNISRYDRLKAVIPATAAAARHRGMPWWTSAEINSWERRRRQVRVSARSEPDRLVVQVDAAAELPEAAVLLPPLPRVSGVNGGSVSTVARHGREFLQLTADVPAGRSSYLIRC
ncbi:MAG TPA: hypothetical protein VHC49_22675 [Mycobacteriales bacterium]|nr:hypothetical protein [Mycobacteriales bacterium]